LKKIDMYTIEAGQDFRVLVVEDDSFTKQLVSNALSAQGFVVEQATSVRAALELFRAFEPHAVISDLDLGEAVSGVDLLNRIKEDAPWTGLVALTAHASPELAANGTLPAEVLYLVKSQIDDLAEIGNAVRSSIGGVEETADARLAARPEQVVISAAQADVLRLIAEGLTNAAIAESRGTSVRAVENLVQRTFKTLNLNKGAGYNPRMEAVRLWRQGKIIVR
jgi:DNA-binding NarL/FixJ family response regulator